MSAATSSRSCATSSRSASASSRRSAASRSQAKAHLAAEERVLDALVGAHASAATRESFRRKLRANELDDKEIEVELQAGERRHADVRDPRHARRLRRRDQSLATCSARPSAAAARRRAAPPCSEAYEPLIDGRGRQAARPGRARAGGDLRQVENNGIVFLDEIDKIAGREGRTGADVSREGVQRDLLPLIEGTTVVDQIRPGEDRPHPLHRLGRVPRRRSRRTCCPSCRAACRSASSSRR